MQTLLDNLIERGLDPEGCYLFIVDGAKALSKALRRTFGADIPIQRCQIHKARNITDRLPPKHHAAVRRALKQAWELNDADKVERLIRKLARRFEQEASDVPLPMPCTVAEFPSNSLNAIKPRSTGATATGSASTMDH